MEAKLTFKWMDVAKLQPEMLDVAKLQPEMLDVAKLQPEIIDFQENVSLKQAFCDGTPETFWASRVRNVNFPALSISSSNFNNVWLNLLL